MRICGWLVKVGSNLERSRLIVYMPLFESLIGSAATNTKLKIMGDNLGQIKIFDKYFNYECFLRVAVLHYLMTSTKK